MKRLLIVAMLFSGTTYAQIPVTDVASIGARTLEHLDTIARWKTQYDQMVTQYRKIRDTHTALTGVRNLGEIFDNPLLYQYMPDDWRNAYQSLKTAGYEGLLRKGIDIYNENKVFDACAHYEIDDQRLNCEAQAVHPSQAQGDLIGAFELIDMRADQIKQLQAKINATIDPKAIGELTARIGIEQSAIANEAARIDAMAKITAAEERVLQQRNNEFQAQIMSRTEGITLEPLTFD